MKVVQSRRDPLRFIPAVKAPLATEDYYRGEVESGRLGDADKPSMSLDQWRLAKFSEELDATQEIDWLREQNIRFAYETAKVIDEWPVVIVLFDANEAMRFKLRINPPV